MKTLKRILFIIFTIISAAFTILGLLFGIILFGNSIAGAIVFLVLSVIFGFFTVISYRHAKLTENTTKPPVRDPRNSELFTQLEWFPSELENGQRLYKVYKQVDICVISGQEPSFFTLKMGAKLVFMQEPANRYDSRAVAVYDENQKLGYLYRGVGQDMTNDFIDKGNVILARLTHIDRVNKILKMDVAYYYKRRK